MGYAWVVVAAVAIGFISFSLWGHHMFTTGLPHLSLSFFAAAGISIAVPMGVEVFAWVATLWDGKPVLRVPMLFILGFLFISIGGGLTGVMVAAVPYDWQVHDTYFVVAHFHYVLIGGMVFPIFAALYYWTPVVSGRLMCERLGRWAIALIFVGFNAAFLPMHLTGLRGMPRRVYTYDGALGLNGLNLISTVATFVLAAGVFIFLIDFIHLLRQRPAAGDNPWDAPSLEWLSSNSPVGFRSLPVIDSRDPLWDRMDLQHWVMEGRGYLPDAPTVERESLVTAPITGEPEQILRLRESSWIPFIAALAAAIFFAVMTLKSMPLAIGSGAVALAFLLSWMWKLDQAYPRGLADAGNGLALPLYRNDRDSIGWWAMVVVVISDASLTLSLAFAYVFLWTAHPAVWPPDGSQTPGPTEPALIFAVVTGTYVFFEAAERLNRRDSRLATRLCLIAAASLYAFRSARRRRGSAERCWRSFPPAGPDLWLFRLGPSLPRHLCGNVGGLRAGSGRRGRESALDLCDHAGDRDPGCGRDRGSACPEKVLAA